MYVKILNLFCLKHDLIFVEMGRAKNQEIYWFIDFQHTRRYYTKEEIFSKLGL